MTDISRIVRPFLAALTLLSALAFIPTQAFAGDVEEEETEDESPALPFRQSVGLSPFILVGGLSGNYEYLLGYRHGLMAEGSYGLLGDASGSWSVGAGYRFHFFPGMGGPFLGAFTRGGFVTTKVPLEEKAGKKTYSLESPVTLLGANGGYRWQGEKGWNLVVRGGYGYPVVSDFRWSPTDPEDADIKGIIEGFMGLDVELTLGYSF